MILKNRLQQYLPHNPYCSDNKTASLIRNQYHALLHSYIQINAPTAIAWLVFDIDEPFKGEWCWESASLPAANYIAMSRVSGKYHAVYAVSPVVTGENARRHPLEFLAAIQRTYNKKMYGADLGYCHLITRNPLSEEWLVTVFHTHQYDLSELACNAYDDDGKLEPKVYGAPATGFGRHCDMFNELRYYAYANISDINTDDGLSYDQWYEKMLTRADLINDGFNPPLPYSHVKSTARSVTKWTWARRDKIRVKERKMDLNTEQPLETRQSVGAFYSHDVRKQSTQAKIKKAYTALLNEGVKATQKAVQERSGVGIATIKRYWKQIKD